MNRKLNINYTTIIGKKKGMLLKGEATAHLNEEFMDFTSIVTYFEDCKDIISAIKKDIRKNNVGNLVITLQDNEVVQYWKAIHYSENGEVTLQLIDEENPDNGTSITIELKNIAHTMLIKCLVVKYGAIEIE